MAHNHSVTARIRATLTGRPARERFRSLEEQKRDMRAKLQDEANPVERARLLYRMSERSFEQVHEYTRGWGNPDIDVEGLSYTQRLHWTGKLEGLLASVESAVASPSHYRYVYASGLEALAADVLDRMVASSDLDARMALLDELREAVTPAVGAEAAEVIRCLPYPARLAKENER